MFYCYSRPADKHADHTGMNTTANSTSGIISEAPQDGQESEMTIVFLGVVAGTIIMFLAGTLWAWRKDQKEKEVVRKL